MTPEEFLENLRKAAMEIRRSLDARGPDYPSAHVMLIDALRAYIHADKNLRDELIRNGGDEQLPGEGELVTRCRALLSEIEKWEFNPSLCGLLRSRR